MSFTFLDASVKDTTFKLPVELAGLALAKDANFNVAFDAAHSTAKEGLDFAFVNQDNVFHAGKYVDTFKIKIIRTPILQQQAISLSLKLEPSVDFDTLIRQDKEQTGSPHVKFFITDILLPPANYVSVPGTDNGLDAYMGKFTRKKFNTFVLAYRENNGKASILDIYNTLGQQPGQVSGIALFNYLQEQKALGNIIYEDDGTEMTVGPRLLKTLNL